MSNESIREDWKRRRRKQRSSKLGVRNGGESLQPLSYSWHGDST